MLGIYHLKWLQYTVNEILFMSGLIFSTELAGCLSLFYSLGSYLSMKYVNNA